MVTNRDDDYLICKHYYNHINDVSSEYKDFITFEHNKNHFFAWVNEGKVVLRSEAYPSAEKMERGIKAIIKNREINERYSIDSQHGVHFLVLWGGGNHQKHTGNMQSHNEIGRSCPMKSKDELYAMMGFMGKNFVSKTFHLGGVSKSSSIAGATTAAATGAAAIAATSKSKTVKTTATTATKGAAARASATSSSGGGFKWWYLLPLLLIPIFFMWKGCGGDTDIKKAVVKTEIPAAKVEANAAALAAEKEAKMKADAEAKIKAEADAAKLAAEQKAAKANKGGNGRSSNRSSNSNVNFGGNKSSGY